MADKRKTKLITIVEAVGKTGWSRGAILRRCWAGEIGRKTDGVWMVTLAELEKVGLGKRTISTMKPVAVPKKPSKSVSKPAPTPASKPVSAASSILKNQHLVIVLDNSGSMGHIRDDANRMVKQMTEQFLADFEGAGFDTQVSTWLFGEGVSQKSSRVMPSTALRYPLVGQANEGSTRLSGAIYQAVKDARRTERENEATLILVITDGGENSSHGDERRNVGQTVRDAKDTGRYTITLAGPKSVQREVEQYAATLDLDAGNVTTWEQTTAGTHSLASHTVAASTAYTATRSAGGSSVQNFYRVTTDLSGLTESQVQGLRSINSRFRKAKAEKETDVTAYYIDKMGGKPYVTGAVYYQLVKPEKVQPYKEVLLRHKQTGAIYSNEASRKLLGITHPTDTAHVKPGNNAWYDIFIQSTSDNRILPRGSDVLIDKNRTVSLARTY